MSEFIYETIATALFRSVPVVAIGLLLLACLRKGSGANRHMLCVATLVVLMALPIVNLIPQKQDVPMPVVGKVIYQQTGTPVPTIEKIARKAVFWKITGASMPTLSVAQTLAYVYVLGLFFLVVRLLTGIRAARRIVADSRELPIESPYPVRLSSSISVPVATWWKRSTIVLPAAASEWPESRLTASISHEAAHIKRGDLVFGLLGNIVKLAYWPNPLVWTLNRKLTETAENATDDCVLGEGISANEYAALLVQTASERRRDGNAFALSMARSSKVGFRVRAILDPKRKRGGPKTAIALTAGVLVASTALGVGRFDYRWQDLARVAIPNGPYKDIQDGLTVPGEERNDWSAVDSAGRKIQLVQIQRWTPTGVEAWKPDGTRLSASEIIKDGWSRHDPSELHLYTRWAKDPEIEFENAGIGSGPHDPGDPPMQVYSGGYFKGVDKATNVVTTVSFLGIPKSGKSGMMSVSFEYGEVAGKVLCSVHPNGNKEMETFISPDIAKEFLPDFARHVHVVYPAYGTPFVFDSKGEAVRDGHGGYVHSKILSTKLTYTELTDWSGNHGVEPVAFRVNTLEKIEPDWNDAKQRNDQFDNSYFWPVSPNEIDHIDIVRKKSFHVVQLNFHVRPDGEKPND